MLTEIAKYRMLSGIGEFLLRLKVSNVHPSRSCNYVIAPIGFIEKYPIFIKNHFSVFSTGLLVIWMYTSVCILNLWAIEKHSVVFFCAAVFIQSGISVVMRWGLLAFEFVPHCGWVIGRVSNPKNQLGSILRNLKPRPTLTRRELISQEDLWFYKSEFYVIWGGRMSLSLISLLQFSKNWKTPYIAEKKWQIGPFCIVYPIKHLLLVMWLVKLVVLA